MKKPTLEFKEIEPYLPYGLEVICNHFGEDKKEKGIISKYNFLTGTLQFSSKDKDYNTTLTYIKPILRPLSDLTKEIEVNGEKFIPMERIYLSWGKIRHDDETWIQMWYNIINWYEKLNIAQSKSLFRMMYEWHFDVESCWGEGLIEKGLAIDIKQLNHKL